MVLISTVTGQDISAPGQDISVTKSLTFPVNRSGQADKSLDVSACEPFAIGSVVFFKSSYEELGEI